MAKILIGILCYESASAETLCDYMRFAYYMGRRMPEHDFFLDIATKTEQFRARNGIVKAAVEINADYLFFLDDDHVIDWEGIAKPNERYGFLQTLIGHMQDNPDMGICGVLYYHRGGECLPVIMKEGKDGGFYYIREDEITNNLQEVAVQGGGCMLIDMGVFDRIESPWFVPEHKHGTDIQLCNQVRKIGKKIFCDTSIVIGHVLTKKQVITPKNRHIIAAECAAVPEKEGINADYVTSTANTLYRMDAEEYLDMSWPEIAIKADDYFKNCMPRFNDYEDKREYYKSLEGIEQLCRQVWFHSQPEMIREAHALLTLVNTNVDGTGLDFGCGSAPIGFEFAMKGHHLDFVDVGGSAYAFLKWRAKKREIKCGWELGGPYDYVLLLDSLEHIEDWKGVLDDIAGRLKPNASILTNYFFNEDDENIEHISMDKGAVKDHLISLGIYPINKLVWMKRDLGFMDAPRD